MKEWWNQLSLRDKRMVSIGLVAIVLFAIYFFILSPLSEKNDSLRNQIEHNKRLLVWMEAAQKQIEASQNGGISPAVHSSNLSVLSTVQEQVKKSSLSKKFNELKQAENDAVQLNFQSVNFDDLISWLTQMWQQYGLVVSQISVTPVNSIGIVNAELLLQKI